MAFYQQPHCVKLRILLIVLNLSFDHSNTKTGCTLYLLLKLIATRCHPYFLRFALPGNVVFERVVRFKSLSDAVVNTLFLVWNDILDTFSFAPRELSPERESAHIVKQLEKTIMIYCHYVCASDLTEFSPRKQTLLLSLCEACVKSVLQFFHFRKVTLYLFFYKLLSNQIVADLLPQVVHLLNSYVALLLNPKILLRKLRVLRRLDVVMYLFAKFFKLF